MNDTEKEIQRLCEEVEQLKSAMRKGWSFADCPSCGMAFTSEINLEKYNEELLEENRKLKLKLSQQDCWSYW